jgi:hypothetical protein
MPLTSLLQSLKDIKNNLSLFSPHMDYVESTWRTLFSTHFTNSAANALANTQSLPTFAMLGKTIHVANRLTADYKQNHIELSDHTLQTAIDYIATQIPDDAEYLNDLNVTLGLSSAVAGHVGESKGVYAPGLIGENVIYYGAPGTGKSYEIDGVVDNKKYVSTVFHPDTQYSDFGGCLKPSMNGTDVEYKFREGPFCKALKLAHENQDEHCYLVIEEINRASAAAVFGEIFQLLDRESDGSSKYRIDINDPDMLSYLSANAPSVISNGQLRLPRNLSIYATMNSSDQAVMPMDTAFKRRWKFKYKPIDFSKCAEGTLKIPRAECTFSISWKGFAESVNSILVEQEIPEDRLLGPWFLKTEEIVDVDSAAEALSGKLFMYLWDDVLRHAQRSSVFDERIKNYGQLVANFNDGKAVFSEQLFELFESVISAEAGNAGEVAEADETSVTLEDREVS